MVFFFESYGHHRDRHVMTHSFPTRRSSDLAQRAGIVVKARATFEPDRLGNGDLDMLDPARVPDRLEQRVAEAQREDVLYRLLAQIMVDAEGAVLGEDLGDGIVDLADRKSTRLNSSH